MQQNLLIYILSVLSSTTMNNVIFKTATLSLLPFMTN